MGSAGDDMELHEAADALGVHYQTAYRWARSGRLPAQLVDHRYVVSRTALAKVEAERRSPAPPPTPSRRRVGRQAELMHDALLDGDEATARKLAGRLVEDGTSLVDVMQLVFAPALRHMGQAWHDGDVPIWMEHRATAIVERTLGELAPNQRGRRRGTAMIASVDGDRHSLPTTMAAVALREANWNVHHLGANMPPDELVRFCAEYDVDLAVLSLTNPDVSALTDETADRLRAAGTPTIVGGPGRPLEQLLDEARVSTAAATATE